MAPKGGPSTSSKKKDDAQPSAAQFFGKPKRARKPVDQAARNGEEGTDLSKVQRTTELSKLYVKYKLSELVEWDTILRLRKFLSKLPASKKGDNLLEHYKDLERLEVAAKDGRTSILAEDGEHDNHEPFHASFVFKTFLPENIGGRRSAKKLLQVLDAVVLHGKSTEVVRARVNCLSVLATKYFKAWIEGNVYDAEEEDEDFSPGSSGSSTSESEKEEDPLKTISGGEIAAGLPRKMDTGKGKGKGKASAGPATKSRATVGTGKRKADAGESSGAKKAKVTVVLDSDDEAMDDVRAPLFEADAEEAESDEHESEFSGNEDYGDKKSYYRRPSNISTRSKAGIVKTFFEVIFQKKGCDTKLKCNHCSWTGNMTVGGNYSTTGLHTHIKTHHPDAKRVLDLIIDTKFQHKTPVSRACWAYARGLTTALAFTKQKISIGATPIGMMLLGQGSAKKAAEEEWSEEGFQKYLSEFIAGEDQPFTITQSGFLRRLLEFVAKCPSATKIPTMSDKTSRAHVMVQVKKAMEKVRTRLKDFDGKIHFSLDAWTSSNQIAFVAVIAHYVDKDFVLRQDLIDFFEFPGSHTGKRTATALFGLIKEYGIEHKVGCFIADNASNMDSTIAELEPLFAAEGIDFDPKERRLRCHAHIIHLSALEVLQIISKRRPKTDTDDAEEEEPCQDVLARAAASVASLEQRQGIELADEQYDGDNEGADLDFAPWEEVDTAGWENIVPKIRAITRWTRSSPNRRSEWKKELRPNLADGEIAKFLLLDSPTRWSSTYAMLDRAYQYRTTINKVVKLEIETLAPYAISAVEWDVVNIIRRWLKSFADATLELSEGLIPSSAKVAAVYDCLMDDVSEFLSELPEGAPSELKQALAEAHNKLAVYSAKRDDSKFAVWAAVFDHRYKKAFFYQGHHEDDYEVHSVLDELDSYLNINYSSAPSAAGQSVSLQGLTWTEQKLAKAQSTGASRRPSEELAAYCADETAYSVRDGGTLAFWKTNACKWPQLARMARDMLSIPGSSVGVERTFSAGRDIISLRRQSMKAETIRRLMIYRAHLRDKYRVA
ncbi:hypothetical protein P7C70_g7436, partial [Phenoliferia sp. Uapishka_3]